MGGGDLASDGDSSSNHVVSLQGEGATVNIHCSNGTRFAVQVKLDSTVENFKSIIAQKCEIPPHQQRLIYKGRILKDDQTLESYGIEADHAVHLVRGFATATSAGSTAATGAGVPRTNSVSTTYADSNEVGPLGGSVFGSSLFPGLGGNGLGSGGGLFGAELPEMEQLQDMEELPELFPRHRGNGLGSGGGLFGAELQEMEQMERQLTQNPNMMGDILNMPLVQNIMNNPETIRNLIMNNPQMREIMDRNPELAHILNDPATLRQTMEAARNPELMREMMRNTDRAMSNIESSPEGFNMLRRMYENVQEPFLNATTMAGDNRSDLGLNQFVAPLGAQGVGAGREHLTSSTTSGSDTTTYSPAPNTNPLPNPWASSGTAGMQTNFSARSNPNPTEDSRPMLPGGLGGSGFQDFEQMLGSMPDRTSFDQLMQNPVIPQIMRGLLSSPQYMNQILGLNPQLQNMLDSNPQLRDMLQSPEFVRLLTSPEMMQTILTSQLFVSSQPGRQQPSGEPGQNAVGTDRTRDNLGLNMVMNTFGGLGAGSGGFGAPNRSQAPPEELYATQLSQLQEMGFFDTQENIRALIATAGNVNAAVECLLGNPGQ